MQCTEDLELVLASIMGREESIRGQNELERAGEDHTRLDTKARFRSEKDNETIISLCSARCSAAVAR
jgi:hypothetical protein